MPIGGPSSRQNVSDLERNNLRCQPSGRLFRAARIDRTIGDLGFDVVNNDAGDQGSWNRFQATQWLHLPGPARRDGRSPGSSVYIPIWVLSMASTMVRSTLRHGSNIGSSRHVRSEPSAGMTARKPRRTSRITSGRRLRLLISYFSSLSTRIHHGLPETLTGWPRPINAVRTTHAAGTSPIRLCSPTKTSHDRRPRCRGPAQCRVFGR